VSASRRRADEELARQRSVLQEQKRRLEAEAAQLAAYRTQLAQYAEQVAKDAEAERERCASCPCHRQRAGRMLTARGCRCVHALQQQLAEQTAALEARRVSMEAEHIERVRQFEV
jgi:hypothetical protein